MGFIELWLSLIRSLTSFLISSPSYSVINLFWSFYSLFSFSWLSLFSFSLYSLYVSVSIIFKESNANLDILLFILLYCSCSLILFAALFLCWLYFSILLLFWILLLYSLLLLEFEFNCFIYSDLYLSKLCSLLLFFILLK